MMPRDSELGEMVAQFVVEQQHRFAKTIMGDADALETDGVAHAAADGFGKGFLGGETLGEQARDVRAGLVFRQLALAQHARRETFAVTRPQRFDAGDLDDVGADSEYHDKSTAQPDCCVACSFSPRLPIRHVSSFTARLLALWLARYDFSRFTFSSAFIFLTAASSPMNTDSAMMAWPMFSSTMLGIATMGCTLW